MSPDVPKALWTPARQRVTLARLIKSGGAGSVFLLGESSRQVAKIYHSGAGVEGYRRKVAAMLSLSPELPEIDENGRRYVQIAWPQALLQDDHGGFVGFLMPALDVAATIELEYILQERQARANGLPTGLGQKVTLAANLASVIAELHRQKHYVVDLKPVNLRFYRQSLYMAMLDCDGFSIQGQGERFPAEQVTPEYLAPEYQARGIGDGGEEDQDRFAMAVVVFQLLNFGIHPFTGRPASDRVPTDIPSRIAGRFYAYGLQPNPAIAPSPVSGHGSFPAELRQMFDRAFSPSPVARPSANEWSQTLRRYAQRASGLLTECRVDASHQHFAGLPCAACARADLVKETAKRQGDVRRKAASTVQRVLGWRTPPPNRARPAPNPQPAPIPSPRPWPIRTRVTRSPASSIGERVVGGLLGIAFFLVIRFAAWLNVHSESPGPSIPSIPASTAAVVSPPTASPDPGPPARPPMASTAHTRRACAGSWGGLDYGSGRLAVVTASSARYLEQKAVLRGFEALMRKATALDDGGASPPEEMRSKFLGFAIGQRDDGATRNSLVDLSEAGLDRLPGSAEAAFERGWLALSAGHVELALDVFACGVHLDPRYAPNWYGLGVTSMDDSDASGLIAVAYLLEPNQENRQLLRTLFDKRLVERTVRPMAAFIEVDRSGAVIAQRLDANGLVLPKWPGAALGRIANPAIGPNSKTPRPP